MARGLEAFFLESRALRDFFFKAALALTRFLDEEGRGDLPTARVRRRAGLGRELTADWAGAGCGAGWEAGAWSQPFSLRTAIIVRRISFQVSGCIITALGNMQPSQQMCWSF